MLALPNQSPGLLARTHLSREEVDREAWAIDGAGRHFAGAAAINRTLAELGRWRVLARLYALPGIRQAEDAFYRWFAANRGRFARWGAVPACARPDMDCVPERETESSP